LSQSTCLMKGQQLDTLWAQAHLLPGMQMFTGQITTTVTTSPSWVDGQFDKLEEVRYIESHLSKTSTKYNGEMIICCSSIESIQVLIMDWAVPGAHGFENAGNHERLTAKEAKMTARV